jgi:hypothetical protein
MTDRVRIDRASLDAAVRRGVLQPEQAQALWAFLGERTADAPTLRFAHVLYYLGGLLAIGAMTLFMTLGWEMLGGRGLLLIAAGYAAVGLWLTERLLHRWKMPIPAGIAAVFVVALAPLAVYGLQAALGFWPEGRVYRDYHHRTIDWRWVLMELGTLAAGAAMLWRYRLPFLVMPIAATLWYMSMDATPFLFADADAAWESRRAVSLGFGLAMVLGAVRLDVGGPRAQDHAFWLHLFGVTAFWFGASLLGSHGEPGKFLYLCVNLLMIALGTALSRRVYAVFGGLGVAAYVGHLAYTVFSDSVAFPFVLTLVGLGIVYLGILWQRHEPAIARRLRGMLPAAAREAIERRS